LGKFVRMFSISVCILVDLAHRAFPVWVDYLIFITHFFSL
jgi:pyrimidine operon attenuation protein/uracil phosphoribosyltransferase